MKSDRIKELAVRWGIVPLKWQDGKYKYSFSNFQGHAAVKMTMQDIFSYWKMYKFQNFIHIENVNDKIKLYHSY